jgi:hypothetical protein
MKTTRLLCLVTKINKSFKNQNMKLTRDSFNIPKVICNHLVGKNHSKLHRHIVGIIFIALGVVIADLFERGIAHSITECLGGIVQGVGTIPLLEKITEGEV